MAITDSERSNIHALARQGDVERITAEAEALEAKAAEMRERAAIVRAALLARKPLLDRLVFAAHERCECGAGMAYDPASKGNGASPFKGPSMWECSDILRFETFDPPKQASVKGARHSSALPFAFYEVKSERQPSAHGATTRPVAQAA